MRLFPRDILHHASSPLDGRSRLSTVINQRIYANHVICSSQHSILRMPQCRIGKVIGSADGIIVFWFEFDVIHIEPGFGIWLVSLSVLILPSAHSSNVLPTI
jgi:hypothetical protein